MSESRELDFGEQAVVSYFRQEYEEMHGRAEVLVLVGGVMIEVTASEDWDGAPGRPDFTGDDEALAAIAERAAAGPG